MKTTMKTTTVTAIVTALYDRSACATEDETRAAPLHQWLFIVGRCECLQVSENAPLHQWLYIGEIGFECERVNGEV
jgi:hypothetical protein